MHNDVTIFFADHQALALKAEKEKKRYDNSACAKKGQLL